MKSQLILFFTFLAFSITYSQEIYEFPEDQTDYIGGNVQFYKDFRKVIIDKNMQPCEDKRESISFKIVIYPDKKIKYVKDENTATVEKNKCALNLSKEVAKYLTGWNPATVDGNKVIALTSFWIIPHELFQELPEGYDPANNYAMAEYEGGINKFRKKVFQSIDLTRFKFSGKFKLQVTFTIDSEGNMSDIKLDEGTGLKAFDDMVIRGISTIRNKWIPATVNGFPVKSHFRLPLSFSMD